jgi:hypothetical protein
VIDGFWSGVIGAVMAQFSKVKPSPLTYGMVFLAGAIGALLFMIFCFSDSGGWREGIDIFISVLFTPLVPISMIVGGLFLTSIFWFRIDR